MLIFEIEGPQAERREIEEKWLELHFSAPHIDLNQKEFTDSRNALLKERKEALKGVDAHIDWLREALTVAAVEFLHHESPADNSKFDKAIADKVDYFLRNARGNLSPDVLQILERERERSKKAEDERVKREAEENQKPLPGFEQAVEEAKGKKGKGKKAGAVTTTKVSDDGDPFFPQPEEEQVPREETFKKPEESNDLDIFAEASEEKQKLTAIDGGKASEKKTNKKTSKK